ncbi:MAG: hypothetical protein EHM73_14120 [Chroococcales cyanobacterium metabat2.561]|jgi:hypothetical protein|uniref:Calcium-binding protein n=1 Tax=Microcystis aeruginosa Ma_SC_T_19800800_S464 TaxID=2486257 RepID=A0A552DIV6_MICAE|nr:hypothetical protein [Microcystis aeruginosa W13-18]NCR12431.1 hypothetical protein [Microcystis aeruginosa SX13-11]NCR17556.1 hypothetical protein [Microcystis aeruginosa LL13-03]NCR34288.1 hypothetical protein [Microcystis aeruginosa S11-05]NCR43152.1 hypothetical protein [Microcystis aeruginosa SX13-01]NCR48055.1 hypothetical protein [Microcystis aeruginosa S11-01]NCR65568.1 hypothetical protein [Microcystis aeruginosa LL11-07]NCR88576.1 hypothetical protein [Microcystis aeruginosa G13
MKLIFKLAPAITFISLSIAGTAEAQITSSQQNYPSILFISQCSPLEANTTGCTDDESRGNNQYPGGGGNDQYTGSSGNDQYTGSSGNDDLSNQGGNSSNNENSNEKIPNMRGVDGGANDLRY